MDDRLTFNRSISLVKRNWRLFLIVGVAGCVLSALLSGPGFIKPRYRSQAVVYPVNISTYSVETTTDQLLQLMESNSIRDSVVRKFGLAAHYGLDTTRPKERATLLYLWKERVSIEKTRYESVDLQVTDEDPVMARNLVLEVLHQTNLFARSIQRQNSLELLKVIQLDLAHTKAKLDSVEVRMDQLRQADGLLDYTVQAEELTKGYMRALAGNAGKGQKDEIAHMLKSLEEHGGEFQRLSVISGQLASDYAKKLAQELQVQLDLSKELTYSDTVVSPEVPDKKVYPIRWLIVLVSTFTVLLLCYVLLFLRGQAVPTSLEKS